MEKNASLRRRLTLAQPSTVRQSFVWTCGDSTRRCLKAIAKAYLESAAYNAFWIGAYPLPTRNSDEASGR